MDRNIIEILGNQFYYVYGPRRAMLIRADFIIPFDAERMSFTDVAQKWNLIVEDLSGLSKDIYIDTYLENEWGLRAKVPGQPSINNESMFVLEPVNDEC